MVHRRRAFLVLAASALLLVIGGVGILLLQRLAAANEWLLHTREVQLGVSHVRTVLASAETAQRGFLLTRNAELLAPLPALRLQAAQIVEQLKLLTRDNPRQQARIPALMEASTARLRLLEEIAALAVSAQPARALERVRSGEGARVMQQAMAVLDAMEAEEDRLLRERLRAVHRQHLLTRAMLVALVATGVALLWTLHVRTSRATRRLRDSEELTRALIDNAPVLVRVRNPDGGPALSNRGYKLLERAPDFARLEAEIARLEDAAQVQDRSVQSPAPLAYAGRHFDHIGFPVRADDGRPLGVASILADVSALESARAALQSLAENLEDQVRQRTRELSEANTQLEAYGYMVSHDLRAPLRAVNGYLDAIEEDHGAALGPRGGELVRRARVAAERMERLIGDLLDYSRLSRAEIRREAVSLDTVVRRARAEVETMLSERGATLDVSGPLPVVEANEAVLTQVLINLLVNAATYVAPGERPRIRLRGALVDGGKARVSVSDEGIGIAEEDQARIFLPFERLHGLDRYPGSGIGLAIVRKGVERLGGQVGLESTPGRGSCFWFELPLAT